MPYGTRPAYEDTLTNYVLLEGTAFRWMTVDPSRRPRSTFSPSVVPVLVGSCNIPLLSSFNMFTCVVPVIAVFTKFDALEKKAYQALRDNNCSWEEAKAQALDHAVAGFKPHLEGLYKRPYPPKSHAYLRGKASALILIQSIMSLQICIRQMPTAMNS